MFNFASEFDIIQEHTGLPEDDAGTLRANNERRACLFGPFVGHDTSGRRDRGADSEGWRSPQPWPVTRASSDRHRAPPDLAQRDRTRSRPPTLR